MANPNAAPRQTVITSEVDGVASAGNDDTYTVGVAGSDATVAGVTFTPEATIAGAATNNRTVSLVNKGQNGAGNTVIATLNFGNGVNAPGFDETQIPLSGTPANLDVAAGDVLAWSSVHVGTGITDPGGNVRVTLARR